MSDGNAFWDRTQLYAQVWSVPMQRLANQYGISDVGLAKVCRKLQIPLPGRGYWAKRAHGHDSARPPLPTASGLPVLQKPRPRAEPPVAEPVAETPELKRARAVTLLPSSRYFTRRSLRHPLIASTREVLSRARIDDRGILRPRGCLDIQVSKNALPRALKCIAALIAGLEAEAFQMTVDPKGEVPHTASRFGQKISFGLRERVKREFLPEKPPSKRYEFVLTYAGKPIRFVPTGELHLEISNCWSRGLRKCWSDGKHQSLEEQIADCIAGFIRVAIAEREEQERREQERQRQLRLERERAELWQRIQEETRRVRDLECVALSWSRGQRIRSFIAAVRDFAARHDVSVNDGSKLFDWLRWADEQADRLDPLVESPSSILDRKPEFAKTARWLKRDDGRPKPCIPKPIWRMDCDAPKQDE